MSSSIVWTDNHRARVFKLGRSGVDAIENFDAPARPPAHGGKPRIPHLMARERDESELFAAVARSLDEAHPDRILIVGPGNAKTRLSHHLQRTRPKDLGEHVVGVVGTRKVNDDEILALARTLFAGDGQAL